MSWLTLIHAALVGALLGGAAAALEAALRHRRLPARWVWAVALAGTLAAPLWGPALQRATGPEAVTGLDGLVAVVTEGGAERAVAASRLDSLRRRLGAADGLILPLWGATALATLLVVSGSFVRLSRQVSRMPRGRVGGDEVVISSTFGPACVGLSRARVVIPRWLLALGRDELDLVIRHERAHADARDPLLLAAALGAVALAPWNPALWWHMVRLRRAVELDCDGRVLASGAAPGVYGRVLLSVLGRLRAPSFPAPALLEPTTFLERRLELMRHPLRTQPHRTLAALALSAGLLLMACEVPAPTSVAPTERDRDRSDGVAAPAETGSAPEGIRVVGHGSSGPQPAIYVDGRIVDDDRLDDIDPDGIDAIEILKGAAALAHSGEAGRSGVILITTKAAGGSAGAAPEPAVRLDRSDALPGTDDASAGEATATVEAWAIGRSPIVFVDGVKLAGGVDALVALPKEGPRSIAAIEVVKGGAAEAIWGPEGRDGVVNVRTKGAAGGG